SSKALAAAFEQPWGATDGLSSRRQQCNPLRFAKRLPVATLTSGISQMEDGLRYLPSLAQRRSLAENSRYAPGHASVLLGAQEIPQCGDHRQSNHQNDGGRWPAGLRCWKEDQRTQTPYRCRHTWPDTGDRCPSGGYPRLRRSRAGFAYPRPVEGTLSSVEGHIRGQRLRQEQPARVCERRLWVAAANGIEASRGQRVCCVAKALDRRTHARLARTLPTAQ